MKNLTLYALLFLGMLSSSLQAQKWQKVACGGFFSVALRSDGTAWTTGYNTDGQLGDDDTARRNTFAMVGSDTDWIDIAAGGYHCLALKRDGSLWAWGDNLEGQCANAGSSHFYVPVQIGNDKDWTYISASTMSSYAMKKDGSIWAWGYNYYGQIGDSTTNNVYVPYRIDKTLHKWKQVCGGHAYTMALREDGTIWSWDLNQYGQLGQGNYTHLYVPKQMGSDSDWVEISSGFHYSMALKKDSSIWAWGLNVNGQLGQGDTIGKNYPVKVGADKDWIHIYSGASCAYAIKKDSSLYGWGFNGYGQLTGLSRQYDIPKLLDKDKWKTVSVVVGILINNLVYGEHFMGIKSLSPNTICALGDDRYGQLGNNEYTSSVRDFDCTIGINSSIKSLQPDLTEFQLFPNPADNEIRLQLPEHISKLVITDIAGKEIYTASDPERSGKPVLLDISFLKPGMYIVKCFNGGNSLSAKMLKM